MDVIFAYKDFFLTEKLMIRALVVPTPDGTKPLFEPVLTHYLAWNANSLFYVNSKENIKVPHFCPFVRGINYLY